MMMMMMKVEDGALFAVFCTGGVRFVAFALIAVRCARVCVCVCRI
jgi:hypothetical protein